MIGKVMAFSIIVFAAIVAYMVGTRIDQETISLLSGTAIGILVTTPCAALITYILMRRRDQSHLSTYERSMRANVPMPQSPPQYWVLPQMTNPPMLQNALNGGHTVNGWNSSQSDANYLPRPSRRFYVIGENGKPELVDGDPSISDDLEMETGASGAAF